MSSTGVPELVVMRSDKDYDVDSVVYRNADGSKNQSKVLMSGTGSLDLNVGNDYANSFQVTHNLGYNPFILAWCREVGVTYWQPLTFYHWEGGDEENYFDRVVIGKVSFFDTNNVYLEFYESPDYMSETPYTNRVRI